MGKRGPKPKDPSVNKSRPVSIRLTPALKERLELERKIEGRPLSQEIELRLRQSFEAEQKLEERFHGRRIYKVMQLIADQIEYLEKVFGRSCWEDPFLFDQVVISVKTILGYLRPKGRKLLPEEFSPESAKNFGKRSAEDRLSMCQILARAGTVPKTDGPEFRIYSVAHNIITQFAKTGRDPLADVRKSLLDQIAEMQQGKPTK